MRTGTLLVLRLVALTKNHGAPQTTSLLPIFVVPAVRGVLSVGRSLGGRFEVRDLSVQLHCSHCCARTWILLSRTQTEREKTIFLSSSRKVRFVFPPTGHNVSSQRFAQSPLSHLRMCPESYREASCSLTSSARTDQREGGQTAGGQTGAGRTEVRS